MKQVELKNLVKVSIFGALAFVIMLIEFPLGIFPDFLKLDFSDCVALIISFALGPAWGVGVEFLKNVLHLFVTKTAGIGEFANFIIGGFFVSIAGVSMNLALAFLFGLLFRLSHGGYLDFLGSAVLEPLEIFFVKSVMINTVLAVFNMVPIPPLDGSRAVMSFFSLKHWELFYRFEMYGFLVITLLLFTGILQKIIVPPILFLYSLFLGI